MERKRIIDMSLEEMEKYTPEEIGVMMKEDYQKEVKLMDEEYQASVNRMREEYQTSVNRMREEYQTSVNRMREEYQTYVNRMSNSKEDDLPCIKFDLPQAKEIVRIIREIIKEDENSGIIDYKYLPDKKKDKLVMVEADRLDNERIGNFYITDMYNNILHSVNLYSNGVAAYSHYVPNHIGIGTKYGPVPSSMGWYRCRWTIPADRVWDLIPKLDPK